MCGLIGIFLGRSLDRQAHLKVKGLFTQVLLANEERGKEATGVAAFWPSGKVEILKLPVPATEFVETKEYRDFLDHWDPSVCSLLGHTRKPTKGSIWNPDNNHPLHIGHTVGIHNGTIKNDDFLFESRKMRRRAQVDSEVIFQMLDTVDTSAFFAQTIRQVQAVTRQLTGFFTTLSVNLRDPREVLVLKYNQPVSFHFSRELDTFFFSSRYLFLRKAFGKQVVTEALDSKTAYVFNPSRSHGAEKGQPYLRFPLISADDS